MIRLENVTKEYDLPTGQAGQLVAADRLTLEVPACEVFGLVGPNGAGKTTTLKMICGLMLPTAGRITVNNIDVERQPEEVQQYIGYLADFFSVYDDLKTWEYVEHFARAYKLEPSKIPARVREVIGVLGLETKYDAFVGGLSRGMKQRLGIARAIIHKPEVLLLDEPASGLDPKARFDLRLLLQGLRDQGTTILISSHILTELEGFCTSIGIMEKGRLVRSGRIEEVIAAEAPTMTIALRCLGAAESSVRSALAPVPEISHLEVDSGTAQFRYAGSEDGLTQLLAELVTAHVRIVSFSEVKTTVEDLYMKLSRHEVM